MGNRIFEKLDDTDLLAQRPILVFAADPLASAGIKGLGQVQHPKPHYRTHAEFCSCNAILSPMVSSTAS